MTIRRARNFRQLFLWFVIIVLVVLLIISNINDNRKSCDCKKKPLGFGKTTQHLRTLGGHESDAKIKELPSKGVTSFSNHTTPRKNYSALGHGLNVHIWHGYYSKTLEGICNITGFPDFPMTTRKTTRTYMTWAASEFVQRIFGFVLPPITGDYTFSISSDDSSELWLSSSEDWREALLVAHVGQRNKIGWTPKGNYVYAPSQKSKDIHLEAGKKYYIEVLHVDAGEANRVEVVWNIPGSKTLQIIENQFLCPFLPTAEPSDWFKYTDSIPPSKSCPGWTEFGGDVLLWKDLPILNHEQVGKVLQECRYQKITLAPRIMLQGDGVLHHLQNTWIYIPKKYMNKYMAKWKYRLDDKEAHSIVHRYMERLQLAYPRKFTLNVIKRVEKKTITKMQTTRYRLELILLDSTSNTKWLLSQYVVDLIENDLCYPTYLHENQQAPINFVTVHSYSNQLSVRSLLKNLGDLQRQFKDKNVGLVVVDSTSEDASNKALVNLMELIPNLDLRLIIRKQVVSPIEGYNVALHHIKDNNSIVFPVTTNVEIIDAAFIDEIQQNCVRGKTVYSPVVRQIHNWDDRGFSLLAMYKSDWERVGGLIEPSKPVFWEDERVYWDVLDRVYQNGLDVERKPVSQLRSKRKPIRAASTWPKEPGNQP